jgi:hypothetical protein
MKSAFLTHDLCIFALHAVLIVTSRKKVRRNMKMFNVLETCSLARRHTNTHASRVSCMLFEFCPRHSSGSSPSLSGKQSGRAFLASWWVSSRSDSCARMEVRGAQVLRPLAF